MEILELSRYYWYDYVDPRAKDLPMISSPIIIPSILVAYLVIVLKVAPDYMANRKPYSFKTFIRYYNVFQVIINAYIIMEFASAGIFDGVTNICHEANFSFDPKPVKIVTTYWLSMILKIIDLIETVLFVLRKKDNQVTFLHLYHHVTTVLVVWMFTKYYPVIMSAVPLGLNCAVHVIMYTYYFFSSFGDKTPKILKTIKPMITILQMVQFVILLIHGGRSFFPGCNASKFASAVQVTNISINFALFYNFYKKSYKTPKKKAN
ncbi:very long chain fatty acid elongase 1-like [Augochlora pura]